jgi:acetolactate synthase-1/2/3 large subunit
MKLSDYVFKFLKDYTDAVFLLSGGGIMHLVDSLGRSSLKAYCCHHEQAAAIAAEGYSRIGHPQKLGVALVTSGPGGTNAITGVAGAWLDSIPLLVLNGQVKRADMMPRRQGKLLLRQIGFQELNNVDLAKPITKYAATVEKEDEIRYHLEKAIWLAREGRPGPVWLEIPLDVQGAEIDPRKLRGFTPSRTVKKPKVALVNKVVELLEKSKRPLLIAGNGIRLAGGEAILWKFLERSRINVVTPIFTADDLVTYEYPGFLGRQGMPGNQTANQAVDNCDLLLIIGERMQLTQTTYDYQNFAPQAIKIMVDIDKEELKKKTLKIDLSIQADAKVFLNELFKRNPKINRWPVKIKPIKADDYSGKKKYLNIYKFWQKLSDLARDMHVATANGMVSLTSHQALKINRGQRFITNAGLGHMGSGLPLAIGACVASQERPTICLEGDGSIMLNIHELQTVLHHRLPLKIFILNNNGYFSIRDTHTRYFQRLFACDPSCGVTLPNFEKLVKAWGLPYQKIENDRQLFKLEKIVNAQGPIVCELMVDPKQPMLPRWKSVPLKTKN